MADPEDRLEGPDNGAKEVQEKESKRK